MLLALGLEVQTFSLMVRALDSYVRGHEFKPQCRQKCLAYAQVFGWSRKFPDEFVGVYKNRLRNLLRSDGCPYIV